MTNWRQHRLTLALLISLLLHLTLIGAPGWRVPTLDDLLRSNASPQLEAHLLATPAFIAPAPKPMVHRPAPHRKAPASAPASGVIGMSQGVDALPAPLDAQPVTQPDSKETVPVPVAAAPSDPAPSLAPAPLAPKLPRKGSIRFVISRESALKKCAQRF